jgi:hypothetical protein
MIPSSYAVFLVSWSIKGPVFLEASDPDDPLMNDFIVMN